MKKQPTKAKKDWRKIVKKYVAKPTAYFTVFVLASYGVRNILANIDQRASIVITTLTILALVYIILDD